MGRPREFDTGEALENAMKAFWTKGYDGTSIQDLMAATGLKKQSLYGAFGNKRELYVASLKRFDETRLRQSAQILAAPGSARTRIANLLQGVIDRACDGHDRSGCFLCNAAVDPAPICQETEGVVDTCLMRFEQAFSDALADTAPFDRDRTARTKRARALLASYFGLNVLAKGGASREMLEDVLQSTLDTIPGPA